MMRCQLIEILIDTMRRLHRPAGAPEESELVSYIIDRIEKNFMEKLSLAELSRKCCYSLAYVSKRFKEETGITFQAYLQAVRIRESCRLLANTSKKITEISELVGYADAKFFNQLFKKQMGMTPREFKKLYNKKGR
jgi:YesN/AraC family two-component response regulator